MNKSTIRLFKAVPIKTIEKKKPTKALIEETIRRGFIFAPEVVANYSERELNDLIKVVEGEIGLTPEKMNSSFHKSWHKVKTAPIQQLIIEQLIHYFTTYGFESIGIYNKESVYVPAEKLEIPELKEGEINIVIIQGYTKKELKEKLLSLLQLGVALGENTIKDVIDVATFVGLSEKEIENLKNKEVRTALYDLMDFVPENPIEMLRYAVFKATDKSLLIKDKATIEMIKTKKNLDVLGLFVKYKNKFGLERLAEIFLRFKPIFLAFRTNSQMKSITNKIRKLAEKHHKPMKEDYLNAVTSKIKKGEKISEKELKEALSKVNVFRQIRLAYSLKFRSSDVKSIMYRIRNGKAFSDEIEGYSTKQKTQAKKVFGKVMDSVIKAIKPKVKGKKVYIPEYISYALPSTEKQFTGDFPSGTCVSVSKDMIAGIHWKNANETRIDLDLSLVSAETGKIGWDASYRTEKGNVLFSGDVTDAPEPNGASELFYVSKQEEGAYIMLVNYFNYSPSVEVPFKIVVAQEQARNMKHNYTIDPNNVKSVAKSVINQKQKVLGLLVTTDDECKFYFAETYIGNSITSSTSKVTENSRKYLLEFYRNAISLNDVLVKAGAKLVKDRSKCDIDLSPEKLERGTILNLIS